MSSASRHLAVVLTAAADQRLAGVNAPGDNRSGEPDGSPERPVPVLLFRQRPERAGPCARGSRGEDGNVLVVAGPSGIQLWVRADRIDQNPKSRAATRGRTPEGMA